MIAKQASALPAYTRSGYPEPFAARVLPREKRKLGDAFGLTRFGVNLTTLPPGRESSMRHWHSDEDELVYVLEGELVLVTDAGEETLRSGMVVGFKAGDRNGHQFVNRGTQPAVYLEVGNRAEASDLVTYVDVDLALARDARGDWRYTHKDGAPY
ncbi:MAG TPA: cupin domain-containing protein [Rhodanobacteraceae bacterium]|nr:cupin domain-containing protein [Rhodanobacteraceae bacterium]